MINEADEHGGCRVKPPFDKWDMTDVERVLADAMERHRDRAAAEAKAIDAAVVGNIVPPVDRHGPPWHQKFGDAFPSWEALRLLPRVAPGEVLPVARKILALSPWKERTSPHLKLSSEGAPLHAIPRIVSTALLVAACASPNHAPSGSTDATAQAAASSSSAAPSPRGSDGSSDVATHSRRGDATDAPHLSPSELRALVLKELRLIEAYAPKCGSGAGPHGQVILALGRQSASILVGEIADTSPTPWFYFRPFVRGDFAVDLLNDLYGCGDDLPGWENADGPSGFVERPGERLKLQARWRAFVRRDGGNSP